VDDGIGTTSDNGPRKHEMNIQCLSSVDNAIACLLLLGEVSTMDNLLCVACFVRSVLECRGGSDRAVSR
jgi:hypothetical protein